MVHKVYLIGAGMGNPDTLTVAAHKAIQTAGLLIGAPRLLEPFEALPAKKLDLIRSDEIVEALRDSEAETACVLLSGDLGFYSGATLLRDRLRDFELVSIPGISSLVYFCSQIGTTWQDAHLLSAHGRDCNIVGELQSHAKCFLLTGGATKVVDVCRELDAAGLGDLHVYVGERLSYEDERIESGIVRDFLETDFADLSVMLVENERPVVRETQAPSLGDDAFIRGDAPMTKEEVRELAVSKLRVRSDDTIWDVGAGTGSVSVELALAAHAGSVYAIEKNANAATLLHKNKERFGVTNLRIIEGNAPDAFVGLPAPTRVFIGGSSGNLASIIEAAAAMGSLERVCITAITLETLSEALDAIERFSLTDVDIVQLSVARAKSVASYHMMMANNPIFLISANMALAEGDDA